MASTDKELEEKLLEAGNRLRDPPSSVEELLPLLEQVESCLSRVEQSPSVAMQNALSPSLSALITDQFVRHSNVDVKVAVASCITEITRITAPDAPYDDEQMKEVFDLIVSSFDNLSDKSSQSYSRRASILETVAKIRSCVVMLDLECDELILQMFHHFFEGIRDYHPDNVFSSMEIIMSLVLEESEDISEKLLSPIIAGVKKGNEEVPPVTRKLGEKVLENCSSKLKPYLMETVKNLGISLDDYSNILASICQESSGSIELNGPHSAKENAAEESQAIGKPVEEATQVDNGKCTVEASSKPVDPAVDKCDKSITSNGAAQIGDDDSIKDLTNNKEEDQHAVQSKSVDTPRDPEPDNMDIEKAVSLEEKSEPTTEEREGNEPENLAAKDVSCSTGGVSSTEALPSESDKETVVKLSTPKALETESINVPSPSLSGNIPDENHSKQIERTEKNEDMDKESVEDVPKKVSEAASDSEVKLNILLEKKASTGISDEIKISPAESDSKKVTETTGEEKLVKEPAKLLKGATDPGVEVNIPLGKNAPADVSDENKIALEESVSIKELDATGDSEEKNLKHPENLSESASQSDVKHNVPLEKNDPTRISDGNIASGDSLPKKESDSTGDSEEKVLKHPAKKKQAGNKNKQGQGKAIADEDVLQSWTKDDKKSSSKDDKKSSKDEKKSSSKDDKKSALKDDKKALAKDDKKSATKDDRKASTKDDKKSATKDDWKASTKDDNKELLSSLKRVSKPPKNEHNLEVTSKTNSKRKRTPGKEKESEEDLGKNLVGSKVKVWWPDDEMFYEGIIVSFDPAKKKHTVLYTDGDKEILNLEDERWELIEVISGDEQEKETEEGPDDASATETPKKKAKLKSNDSSAERGKSSTSSKKDGVASSTKSKSTSPKTGCNSKDGGKSEGKSKDISSKDKTPNKPKNDDMDTPKKTVKSKDDETSTPKASIKFKLDPPKTGKSKEETLKTASISKDKLPQSGSIFNANGSTMVKSGSSKSKESGEVEENPTDSAKKLPKALKGSESRTAKKRRRS